MQVKAPATYPDEPEPEPEVIVIKNIRLISVTTAGAPTFDFVEVRDAR